MNWELAKGLQDIAELTQNEAFWFTRESKFVYGQKSSGGTIGDIPPLVLHLALLLSRRN
jgi:hypothetical protein